MEERYPPPGDGNHNDSLQESLTISPSENPNHDPLPETSQPAFRPGTYIVQVPKDQIYRVPPPEHALLAERHRKLPQQKRPCCTRLLCVFISIIVIVLILGLIGGIVSIFLKHDNPTFYIEHVIVKKPPIRPRQQHPEYDITLKTENPNQHTTIFYDQDGDASLSFKQKEIAVGKYPTFDQGPKNSTVITIVLHGSNVALPREIEKSMNGTNSKVPLSLSLSMNVPMRNKIGALKMGSEKIAVACNLTLDTLAKHTRVLSQKCHTKG